VKMSSLFEGGGVCTDEFNYLADFFGVYNV